MPLVGGNDTKPTDNNTVVEIIDWLDKNNINHSGVTKKNDLLNLIK